jgi:hypothetical protein
VNGIHSVCVVLRLWALPPESADVAKHNAHIVIQQFVRHLRLSPRAARDTSHSHKASHGCDATDHCGAPRVSFSSPGATLDRSKRGG